MHLAIDGTLWENHSPDGYDRMARSLLDALGQPATFLGRGPVPAAFAAPGASAGRASVAAPAVIVGRAFAEGRWMQAEPNLMEKIRPAGWLKRTIPRVMTEAHLDRWISFSGNTSAPGGRIFLKDVAPLLWPDTAPRGAADALRARYAEALEDPGTEVLLFSKRAAELLGDGAGRSHQAASDGGPAITNGAAASRVHVLPPYYGPAPVADRDAIKAEYGQGKEYFLWTGSTGDHWRDAMKAFSQFKMRQRSHMRLVLAPWGAPTGGAGTSPGEGIQEGLATYKFRADVTVLDPEKRGPEKWEHAALGAYALLYTPEKEELGWVTLAAATLETPLIQTKRSVATEWAGDAAEWVDPGDPASIAEAMLQLFKDEAYRSRLLKRGRALAEAMGPEKVINRYLCHLS
ncbi:glycosyltransferase family protein [Dinghuibacter silviterrae]|uniref:Glycosyltransferase involved in cell wall biosynthesis n=1 Tax=Dinghuibacter silviterrae TaxID=1539049 RepID=A0A4R8DQ42_9BACT|nr:hypothetical protein [Dinghuibacter silviterrae]TDW99877.1 hypothetical protein EDB95_0891 [Dinghuibacter silviterrae]